MEKYKSFDAEVLRQRVKSVLAENGDVELKAGIGFILIKHIEVTASISLDLVFDFAERYGVSIDYLVGRTDKMWY